MLCASTGIQARNYPKGGKPVSTNLIGIFFEDISSAADGGLYAELVQNGSFEYSQVDNGRWGAFSCWSLERPGYSTGYVQTRKDDTIHPNNPTYMRVYAERVGHFPESGEWTGVGMSNAGFGGISVKAGEKYDFSVFLRGDGMTLRVALVDGSGAILAEDSIQTAGQGWRKYSTVFAAGRDCTDAHLTLLVTTPGCLDVDEVSLMPQDTFMGHGMRKDLALALKDLNPKFMRFPGGCVAHGGGLGIWASYRWKNTVGPRETRLHLPNSWGYHQSMGLGYHEYFQFCEDLGMEPVPILPCGVSCQGAGGGWGLPGHSQYPAPMEDMDEWTQDVLDLIEWANGDESTTWGKVRAAQGHPAPFGLKYIGLGNEEYLSPEFEVRFRYMYEKVVAAHPEIVIVGTGGPYSHPGDKDYENAWRIADDLGLELLDEHYYEPRDWFFSNRQYDSYPRGRKTKVYLGEYAAKGRKLIDALSEAIYLLHVELNADVVQMASYAPLFAKKNAESWSANMIYFDNERMYLSGSYFVQQMFGQSSGDVYYGDCVKIEGYDDKYIGQSVILDTKSRRLYVKFANATAKEREVSLDLRRFGSVKSATIMTLTGDPDAVNTYESQPLAPVCESIKLKNTQKLTAPAYSFTLLSIDLR